MIDSKSVETVINRFDNYFFATLINRGDYYSLEISGSQKENKSFSSTFKFDVVERADLLNIAKLFEELAKELDNE